MEEKKPGDSKGDFSLARKALRGLSGPKGDEKKAEPPPAEGDILSQLVSAMKKGPGLGAVEPEGYAYFEGPRGGGEVGPESPQGAIEAVQRVLAKLGYKTTVTGFWDAVTEDALRRFQEAQGCKDEDGRIGPLTVAAFDRGLGLAKAAPMPREDAPRSGMGERVLPATGNSFIDGLAPGAVRGMRDYGVPASVSIALAVLESQWGRAPLARDYHNLFAVKGKGPAGSVAMRDEGGVLLPGGTTEYRRYNDDAEAVHDHARLFASSDQYRGIMSHKDRPEEFAKACSGTYSPLQNYGATLIRIMKQFDLGRFDRAALSGR